MEVYKSFFEENRNIDINALQLMSMGDITTLLGDPNPFLTQIMSSLKQEGIHVENFMLDHICYRVETQERYTRLKREMCKQGKLLLETMIGGRPISTFRLDIPFIFQKHLIYCLELPSPKQSSFYPEGYEHAEFVIPDSFDEFMRKHPRATFNEKARGKKINPDISINYGEHSVKFHHHSLAYVIEYLE